MSPRFPFVAVVGQEPLKTALLLNVIDPAIGGLLVSGARGSAKSTIVRALIDLEPDKPFVNIPLGASEEMVTGSFDLQQALADSTLAFRPGLLKQADGGVLYVDEVNLLADHLVDLLLDCAASGINHVERDGISHHHDARFALVGTMNPDEGELRPQFLDRFGLACPTQQHFTAQQRQEIVARRLDFDRDPDAFCARWQADRDDLRARLLAAGQRLPDVVLGDDMAQEIARRCDQANVEGLRADIVLHRAARANAALNGHLQVEIADLDAIEDLALAHRRRPRPDEDERSPPGSGNAGGARQGSSIQGSWGQQPTRAVMRAASPEPPPVPFHKPPPAADNATAANARIRGRHHSAQYRATDAPPMEAVDWRRTLARGQQFIALDAAGRRAALRYRARRRHSQELDLLIVDTSASVLDGGGLRRGLGFVAAMVKQCYRARRKFGLITFGNNRARMVFPPRKPPQNPANLLDTIGAGGGTPLVAALDLALNMLTTAAATNHSRIFLLTDGRVDMAVHRHPLFAAQPLHIIDMENTRAPLGRARQLAATTGAGYSLLSALP